MSEEELKKTIDIVAGIEVSCETEAITKEELMSYAEQLQQEIKKLKEALKNNSKIGVADHKYASEIEDKYLIEHNILTEFEKWLDSEIERYNALINPKKGTKPYGEELHLLENTRNRYMDCKNELQELKDGKK